MWEMNHTHDIRSDQDEAAHLCAPCRDSFLLQSDRTTDPDGDPPEDPPEDAREKVVDSVTGDTTRARTICAAVTSPFACKIALALLTALGDLPSFRSSLKRRAGILLASA